MIKDFIHAWKSYGIMKKDLRDQYGVKYRDSRFFFALDCAGIERQRRKRKHKR
jgi:hypothetical protein